MRRLARDLGGHYGYIPELTDMFLAMFSPAECVEFMAANDKPRPLVIRTNTLKARRKDLAQALVKRGVSLEPLSAWSKVALKIVDSQVGERAESRDERAETRRDGDEDREGSLPWGWWPCI